MIENYSIISKNDNELRMKASHVKKLKILISKDLW